MPAESAHLSTTAKLIPLTKKYDLLKAMSEEEFRDRVVRPLFLRMGMKDGRDTCGPDEEGKDAIFLEPSVIGPPDIVVVQTKAGNMNLASKASENLTNAVAQLRTALATNIPFIATKQKHRPSKVMLVVSGKMNVAARKHITDEISDPALRFLDVDELIPSIDEHYPELWLHIDANVMPYMKALRNAIENSNENVAISELFPGAGAAATDSLFLELYLWRTTFKVRKRHGKVEQVPDFIEVPSAAVLSKPDRLVLILGEAGSGKSTSIRRMAYVLAGRALAAEGDFLIPVLMRATEIARRPSDSLLDLALVEASKLTSGASPFGSEELSDGRVVMLIDGLDEVALDHDRASVTSRISQFHEAYPACLVIVTSREYAFLKSLGGLETFTRYRVRKISFRQAQQLVDKLENKGSLPAATSKELIRRLEEIHGMDLNPLLVTVFAATNEHSRQDIPANITELFQKFTEMMLGRWDISKGFAHQYHAPLKAFVLTKIAFQMHLDRVTDITIDDFTSRVAADLESRGHKAEVDVLIDEILGRSGLLRIVGDRIEFRHLLLQEFFAGRGIPAENTLLENLLFDDWWRRALVFHFGSNPSDSAAIARVRRALPSRTPVERFTAAGTVGLALQACYLLPVTEKVEGMVDVITTLAVLKDELLMNGFPGSGLFPLTRFIGYYLSGRDSVALSALEDAAPSILKEWRANLTLSDEDRESRIFWLIIGLLEAGRVTEAENYLKSFHPTDAKMLLAIHLGCFLIQHIRVSTGQQKKSAKRICDSLSETVSGLRQQVLDEYRSELLELRKGEVKAIEAGDDLAS